MIACKLANEPMSIYDTKSFEPRASLGFLIQRVRLEILDDLDHELEPLGITSAQYVILIRLSKEDATSASALCRGTSYDPGAMTRMIDRLEKKGLLRRVRRADDRRKVDLELTAEGRAVQPKLIDAIVRVLNRRLLGFSKDEVQQLEGFLQRMLAAH
jgi:MarR family transcriptional regulator, multiple antibiotic resistance protein MarR